MTDTQTTTTEPIVTTTPEAAKPEPKFSQADMDAVAGRRAKEAAASARKQLLEELGITNADDPKAVDTVKATLTEAQAAREAKKTAEDKALERIAALEKERDEAKQAAEAANATRINERVNGKLESAAMKAKVQHPEDVVKYIRENFADMLAKAVGEDGKLEDKAAEKLVASVKEVRPNWFAIIGQGSPSNRDGRPMQPNNDEQFKRVFGDKRIAGL